MYMEPLNAFCTKDAFGRLVIVSSTQIVFHVRRNVATALGIPSSKIRVIKPRIGGGFGAKQTSVCICHMEDRKALTDCLYAGGMHHRRQQPPRNGDARTARRHERRHDQGNRSIYAFQYRCLWRARTDDGRTFRTQIDPSVSYEGMAFLFGCRLHQLSVCRRLPGIRRAAGTVRGGICGQ